ncbi:TPA: hypothetical protein PTV43_001719 [Clostridium botulinum]|uniref:COG1361 S-layer family protein n=1 Tax=Clostridium TaxID=1485 RepID=UPI0005EF6FAF|nr:hypothetical protein [Clostridium sporogenes]EJE7234397.1 hypothetical protein [Clostridium botulinum]MBW5458840.1 hypothetical protein [Clostridium sporogenes]MCR1975192.1 hypothetical protein [Clostridium sporogenes]MCW6076523.1 hypothetical protein [Clostridium sporogenes]NFP93081.1 hypothetical protein [Clostridium sporogenes]
MKKSFFPLIFLLVLCLSPISLAHAESGRITLNKVTSSPEIIEPGSKFKINFSITNNKEANLKDVVITLVGSEDKKVLTGFSPVGSTNEIYVGHIDGETSKDATIEMACDPNLKAGNYNILVKIGYKLYGEYVEETRIIGLILGNKPNLLITSLDASNKDGEGKKLSLNFVNSGKSTLKDVMVNVKAKDKTFTKYFGTMESEDENEFKQDLNLSGDIKGIVEISFKDELNKPSKVSQEFSIKGRVNDTNTTKKEKNSSGILGFFKGLLGIGD